MRLDDCIRMVIVDMPATVKAYTVYQDGYYTIVVNSKLNHEQNILSVMHELEHINNKDFDSMLSVNQIENIRH